MGSTQSPEASVSAPVPVQELATLIPEDIGKLEAALVHARPAIIAHRPHPTKRNLMVGFSQFFGDDDKANWQFMTDANAALYDLDFVLWPRLREALLKAVRDGLACKEEVDSLRQREQGLEAHKSRLEDELAQTRTALQAALDRPEDRP
jgi:hypothetical protein